MGDQPVEGRVEPRQPVQAHLVVDIAILGEVPVGDHRQALRPAVIVFDSLVVDHRPVERLDQLRLDRAAQHQKPLQIE